MKVWRGIPAGAGALLLAVALGCAPRTPGAELSEGVPALLPSVQAYTSGGDVYLVLQVTNTTTAPIEVTFPTGQSYDFVVSQGGRELWRWSEGQMFTQIVREEVIGVGETLRYEAIWEAPSGASGEFEVVGRLTAADHEVEQVARFGLP